VVMDTVSCQKGEGSANDRGPRMPGTLSASLFTGLVARREEPFSKRHPPVCDEWEQEHERLSKRPFVRLSSW